MKKRLILFVSLCLLVTGVSLGCTTEVDGEGNEWNVDSGMDASGDSSTADTSESDTDEHDVDPADTSDEDGAVEDSGDEDGADPVDAGEDDPRFEESSLEGTDWYGVFRVAEDDGITGTVFQLSLMADNELEIGAFGAVTGEWEVFDDQRLRVYNLERDGDPNQPEQFIFDVDVDDQQRVRGFELFIPTGPSGDPYTMRLEQLGDTDYTVDDLDGDWQSENVFTDQDDNDMRLAMRFFSQRIGYGVFNGAYIEFISGRADVLTLDGGTSYWMLLPADGADPQATFAGEVKTNPAGVTTVYAPRQTNPGEEPAEFTSESMENVASFSL